MSATPMSEETVYRKAEIVNSDFELVMILGHDTVSYINSYTSWRRYLWFFDILVFFHRQTPWYSEKAKTAN